MTDEAKSPLRRRMIEDMTIRKFAPKTQQGYVQRVKNFAAFLGRSAAMSSAARTACTRRSPITAAVTGIAPSARARRRWQHVRRQPTGPFCANRRRRLVARLYRVLRS